MPKTIKINSTIGHVAVLCKTRLKLYTVNCALILDQDIAMGPEDALYCCAFYEAGGDDWIGTELIFTGHRRGIANVGSMCTTAQD